MREEYDLTNAKKNPFAKRMKKQIIINLDSAIIDYFKIQATETGIPYQTLINLYLADLFLRKSDYLQNVLLLTKCLPSSKYT